MAQTALRRRRLHYVGMSITSHRTATVHSFRHQLMSSSADTLSAYARGLIMRSTRSRGYRHLGHDLLQRLRIKLEVP